MKHREPLLRWLTSAAVLSATLVACGGNDDGAPPPAPVAVAPRVDPSTLQTRSETVSAQPATRYDATTLSADGTTIYFTVYAPSVAVGNSAPLVMTGPGWGNGRITNLDTAAIESLELVQQGARVALDEGPQGGTGATRGWYVIAFDQRGFGQSTGKANVQDPNIEGKDVQAIITWAENNLTRLAYRKRTDGTLDPVVGAVGGSYGGGFQTIGAGVDKRIDAIVPGVTWYNLATTLFSPAKTIWAALLYTDHAAPAAQQALGEALTTGVVDDAFVTEVYQHSPASYCEGRSTRMTAPGIPAFFIQASGDTLFSLTEGVNNYECFRAANPNSKFLSIRKWHNYDGAVATAPKTETQTNVACDGTSLNVGRMQFSFLAQNLVDSRLDASNASRYYTLPDVRATLDDGKDLGTTGLSVEGGCYVAGTATAAANGQVFQRGGTTFTAPVIPVTAGLPASIAPLINAAPLALITSPAFAAALPVSAATVVDLVPAATAKRSIVGIPTATLTLNAATSFDRALNAPIVFVGLARIRADGTSELLHDQVTPIQGFGTTTVALPAMSTLLLPGERIGVAVYGFHPRYYQLYSRTPVHVNVTAVSVGLPIL